MIGEGISTEEKIYSGVDQFGSFITGVFCIAASIGVLVAVKIIRKIGLS
jgi:hypothetical protein